MQEIQIQIIMKIIGTAQSVQLRVGSTREFVKTGPEHVKLKNLHC
jgi:hypothetical protein